MIYVDRTRLMPDGDFIFRLKCIAVVMELLEAIAAMIFT